MRKIILLAMGFSSILILPAMAELGQVWTDFQYYSTDLQNYLKYNLSDTLKPLESSSQNAINYSTGDLNIPNPISAGEEIRKNLLFFNTRSDKFENNPAVRATSVSNEINRFITRGSVVSVLGKNGQVRLKSKLQDTQNTIDNIEEYADKAEEDNQGLINQITNSLSSGASGQFSPLLNASQSQAALQLQSIKIQSEQSKIIGENLAQTIQANQSLQYSNLNLANLSQQMEEANRARRVDASAEAARLLRTTSQIDLFGRETQK